MPGYFDDDNSIYKRFAPYEDDNEDAQFLKSLYPPELVQLQLLVEEECDKLEFDGSIMFDQYPDKVRVMHIVDKVEDKYKEGGRSLKEVMVINEMMRRRIRRRHCGSRHRGFC